MNDAVARMLSKYKCRGLNEYINALRVLYGLDRFSEDMDFSLLEPSDRFDITNYIGFLEKETEGFGFDIRVERIDKAVKTPIQSAFLKANTRNQLLVIETGEEILKAIPRGQILKIKLEVDTDPPPGFDTQTRYLLQPIPFSVRAFVLPDLFAGKMHAIVYRRWKGRVKGRDWYDLVWYAAHHPELHLSHLEQRMRQTGDWKEDAPLTSERFKELLIQAIHSLDVEQTRKEVEPFIRHPETLSIWSRDFFLDIVSRIRFV